MSRLLGIAAVALAVVAAIYHLGYNYALPWGQGKHAIVHVGLALVLVELGLIARGKTITKIVLCCAVPVTIILMGFFFYSEPEMEMMFGIALTMPQFVAGVVLIVLLLAVCWLEWGGVIATIGGLGILYLFFGYLIPGPLQAAKLPSSEYAMMFLIGGGGTGIWGQVTPISANVIFLFMLFGGLLEATGVTSMFFEIGRALGRVMRGGAAITALVSSSLLGTVTGATVANVALTGVFTIPAMKRQGIRDHDAAAIEAVASCGGQILPPIMGSGAFIMATFLGVAYIDIAVMAVVPAILFFLTILIPILLMTRRYNLAIEEEPVNWGLILRYLPAFVIPLGIVVVLLTNGYSPHLSITWAVAAVVLLNFAGRRELTTRQGFVDALVRIFDGLVKGARQGAEIAVIVAMISLVTQVLITTALAPKLATLVTLLSGGSILVALVVMMVTCIILGFGLPTVAAYTIVAVMVIPSLKRIGVDVTSAHMFAYYYAVFAAVTPPIATAVIVASRLAGASFWRTAWASMRLMIAPLFLPFVFVFQPQLLDFPNVSMGLILAIFASLLLGFFPAIVTERYLIGRATNLDIGLALVGIVATGGWVFTSATWLLALGTVVALLLASLQYFRYRGKTAHPVAGGVA